MLIEATEAAMTDLGHPVGGQVFVDVHSRGLPNAAGEYTWGDAPDQNYVHEHGRTILCMSNFADRDKWYGTPRRTFWDDCLAECYARVTGTARQTGAVQLLEATEGNLGGRRPRLELP